jgi:tripartite-type tricarboxylate transporter receptor subunit TctC
MLRNLIAALFLVLALGAAHAQPSDWPSKPIRWIVPYPPGGGTDLVSGTMHIRAHHAKGC